VAKFDSVAWAKNVLRRAVKKTRGFITALNKSKYIVKKYNQDGSESKSYGVRWECAMCHTKDLTRKEIEMDHIHPVALSNNFEEWLKYLVCDADGYQVLCKSCHKNIKTKSDMIAIVASRRLRKKGE
jgi:hypothetical protein